MCACVYQKGTGSRRRKNSGSILPLLSRAWSFAVGAQWRNPHPPTCQSLGTTRSHQVHPILWWVERRCRFPPFLYTILFLDVDHNKHPRTRTLERARTYTHTRTHRRLRVSLTENDLARKRRNGETRERFVLTRSPKVRKEEKQIYKKEVGLFLQEPIGDELAVKKPIPRKKHTCPHLVKKTSVLRKHVGSRVMCVCSCVFLRACVCKLCTHQCRTD
jgi:hypothetical protein